MPISSQLSLINQLFSIGTIVVFLFAITHSISKKFRLRLPSKTVDYVLFIASIGLLAGPITYQYYFGFPACTMCWYQRIFMWPIGFMALGTHFWNNKTGQSYVLSAIKWLAPVGLIFSIWHYISQWGLTSTAAACGAVGQSISCDGIDVIVWGFMTIPLMAGLGFISLFLLLNTYTRSQKIS